MALILIRHGQTDGNRQSIIQGTNPDPLNATGVQQALACGQWLYEYFQQPGKKLAEVRTSDIVRAKQTADIVHSFLSQQYNNEIPLVLDHRLREKNRGNFQGWTKGEIDEEAERKGFASKDDFFESQDGVEKLIETKQRVQDFLSTLEEEYHLDSPTPLHTHDIVVISHSQLLKTMIEHIENTAFERIEDFYIPELGRHKILNASITIYAYHPQDKFNRVLGNSTQHLDGLGSFDQK